METRMKVTRLKTSHNGYSIDKVELFNDVGRFRHWYEVIDKETGGIAHATYMLKNAVSWAKEH